MAHLPEGDLEDGLQNYQSVSYDNIDQGKLYFFTIAHDDYLGKVVLKDDYVINIDFTMKHYHINNGWRYHNGKIAAEKEQVANGEIQFYNYINYNSANSGMNMSGGGLVEDINARLDDPSYILPAGTVARRMVPMMRTTPPFFPRKTIHSRRKVRKSRKANKKQKRATRRRR